MLAPSQELWNDSSQLLYFFAENSRLLLTEMKYEKTFFTFFFDNSYNNSYNYYIIYRFGHNKSWPDCPVRQDFNCMGGI